MERLLGLPAPVRIILFGLIAVAVMTLGWMTMSTGEPANSDDPTAAASTTTGDDDIVVPQTPIDDTEPSETTDTDPWNHTEGVDLDLKMPVSEAALSSAAGRAVHFSEEFLSYRYNQDDEKKIRELNRLLADEHAVDLSSVFPEGMIRDGFVEDQTVVTAKATKVAAALISASMLSMNVTVTSTTRTVSDEPQESTSTFTVAMMFSPERNTWGVTEFMAETDDGPFLDESTG